MSAFGTPGLLFAATLAISGTMAKVGPGIWRPFYPASEKEREVAVKAFWLDRTPVSNAEFANFILNHKEWQRGNASALFVDNYYLQDFGTVASHLKDRRPVTKVSWFAAKAYCAAQGKRLPTEAEWEFAAQASELKADGRDEPEWRQTILNWYARPNHQRLPKVGSGKPNYWGIWNLHGLVWEWVADFNSTMMNVDNRSEGEANRYGFCGSGSLKATDKDDYASFMRQAFRSSLMGNYTTANLGFRCAADQSPGGP